jgi:non-heme chloroperoxidase
MVYFVGEAAGSAMSLADATLANGIRLRYRHQGPAIGPAIVLLHGYSDSSLSFARVMPLLPSEQRVIAVDLRGHGDSDRPDEDYRITTMADDVVRLLDALNVPYAVVVGHSMGSFVAQAIVERAAWRVSSLVLLGSAPHAVNATIAQLQLDVEALTDPVDAAFVREFQYSTIALPVPRAFMDAAIANSRRMPAGIWKKVLAGLMEYQPLTPRSSVRTLVLGGTRDAVFSAGEQTALARQFPFGQLRLIDDVGHTLHWELPEVFVRELLRFAR